MRLSGAQRRAAQVVRQHLGKVWETIVAAADGEGQAPWAYTGLILDRAAAIGFGTVCEGLYLPRHEDEYSLSSLSNEDFARLRETFGLVADRRPLPTCCTIFCQVGAAALYTYCTGPGALVGDSTVN